MDVFEAIRAGDAARVRELVETAAASAQREQGLSPLMWALYYGRDEMVEVLRGAGGELDVFEAAAVGETERLRELLDGDLVRAWSADGFTPLHLAAFFGREDAVRLLVERGADLETPARNEQFAAAAHPLHSAAAARRHAVCALLLDAGADVNAREHGATTPLHEAAEHGDAELAELFLAHGADPGARLDDGRTPAELAAANGHDELARRLQGQTL